MILVNLLPHREERRKRRKAAYFAGIGLSAAAGLLIAGLWYVVLQQMISVQQERNAFLVAETRKLEAQQKTLRQREMRAKRKLDALGTLIDLAETEARADDGASSEAT